MENQNNFYDEDETDAQAVANELLTFKALGVVFAIILGGLFVFGLKTFMEWIVSR